MIASLAIAGFLFAAPNPADAAMRIDGNAEELRLSKCFTQLEDPTGKLGVREIIAPAFAERFSPLHPRRNVHLGFSNSAWWLRCELDLGEDAWRGMLEIGHPYLDYLDVHFVQDGQVISSALAGDQRPLSVRPVADNRFIFPLPSVRGEVTLLVRVQSTNSITVPLRWVSSPVLDRQQNFDLMLTAGYWGALFALCSYNLFLFLAVRAWSFVHYVFASLASGVVLLCAFGIGSRYLWPESPQINNLALLAAMLLSVIGGLLFTCSFFSTARRTPRMHRWLIGTAVFQAGGIALIVVSQTAAEVVLGMGAQLSSLLLCLTAYRGFKDHQPGSTPFIVALAIQIAVAVSQGLQSSGLAPIEIWSAYSLQLAAAGMVMLYALAIAVRVNAIKVAKEAAQAQALASQEYLLETLRENEQRLEIRVEQRTQELAEVNALLRQREQQLVDLLHHDPLTGAATRTLFEDRLAQAMARSARNQRLVALLLIDLDGFKAVNDTWGHDAGDAVLVEIARRFVANVRAADTVGRLGGDEFIIVLDELKMPEDAGRVAGKILEAVASPIVYKEHQLQVGASIGIALCPLHARDMQALIKAADHAMYAAKKSGRGCWQMAAVDQRI